MKRTLQQCRKDSRKVQRNLPPRVKPSQKGNPKAMVSQRKEVSPTRKRMKEKGKDLPRAKEKVTRRARTNPKGTQKNSGNQSSEQKGPCLFWPKGLCRRGADCPYRHEGPAVSGASGNAASSKAKPAPAAAAAAAPKSSSSTKAVVALIAASNVLGTAASVLDSSARNFDLEWALDSGAGLDLSSVNAFAKQGVPEDLLSSFKVVSSMPLTFETGGGSKAATETVGYCGDKAGEGVAYMLKNCPYVRSLGKLIQRGFSFFWGPDYEPTLVPPNTHFHVACDMSQCQVAERVEHCVPIFRETISFTYGMPASSSADHSEFSCIRCGSSGGC